VTPTIGERTRALDPALAEAVQFARTALVSDEGADAVGEHLGASSDGERLVTHRFDAKLPGYVGWCWSVTLARASRSKAPTVDEIVLLPGEASLLPPAWVPWSERIQPGDLGVGDILPTRVDDLRLVPGYTGADVDGPDTTDLLEPLEWALGLGRLRVLSREGRDEASDRWSFGDFGPKSKMAQAAPAPCSTCGFLARLGGAMSQAFGACANDLSPADGRVVALDFGCGAHSEGAVVAPSDVPTVVGHVIDEIAYDIVEVADAEEFGHS
jgi:Protein of unknown function (DUF3027)